MNLFRTVFGSRADEYEDKGDDLELHGFCREAAWFYERALESLPAKDEKNRRRLSLKGAESRRTAFRKVLDEAEGLADLGLSERASELLNDARPLASDLEDRGILLARLAAWRGPGAEPPAAEEPPCDSAPEPAAPSGSLEWLEREIVNRPESATAHERLARALEKEGRPGDAIRHFEAAYQRNRENISLVLEIARLHRDLLNDPSAARARLDEACRRHRPNRTTFVLHMERAFLVTDEGRDEEALALLGELLHVEGLDHGLILYNRAGLLEKTGRREQAEADLLRALELSPSNVLYLERLADLLFRTEGDLERALSSLDQALAADAHDFAVKGSWSGGSRDRARLQFKAARILYLLDRIEECRVRVNEGLVVCGDPRVEEALLELRRELDGLDGPEPT